MAEVYKAKEYGVEGFERTVAVKRILPHVAEDEEFIAMFKDEAKIAVQLNHGNIAQIYNLGNEQDSFYIALEYVNGRDLRAIFQKCQQAGRPMPVPQACYIIMKICEGLDYAHNKKDKYNRPLNIVHRDVSPPNILTSFEGEVKLIDFGVAKAAGRASRTQAGILKGKFGYMSPEQVRGMPLDRRSDVFSVGVVLFEILTGQRLFQADTDFATLEKVRAVEVPRPSSLNPEIPKPLENIIYKALAREPEQRYQSAIELHDELQAFMFAQGMFYSRKDLAGWMREHYAREIELEKEKAQRQPAAPPNGKPPRRATMNMPPGAGRPPPPPPAKSATPPPPPRAAGVPARSAPPAAGGRKPKRKTMVMTTARPNLPPPPGKGPPKPRGMAPRERDLDPPTIPVNARMKPPMSPPGKPRPKQVKATASYAAPPSGRAPGEEFDWDDDELETRLFEDQDEAPGGPGSPGGAVRSPLGAATKTVGGDHDHEPPTRVDLGGGMNRPRAMPSVTVAPEAAQPQEPNKGMTMVPGQMMAMPPAPVPFPPAPSPMPEMAPMQQAPAHQHQGMHQPQVAPQMSTAGYPQAQGYPPGYGYPQAAMSAPGMAAAAMPMAGGPAPMGMPAPGPGMGMPMDFDDRPPKSNAGLVVIIVFALLVLFGAGAGGFWLLSKKGNDGPGTADGGSEVAAQDSAGKTTAAEPGTANAVLTVESTPSDATVTVDGKAVEGPSPFIHTLPIGRHAVRVEHPDYMPIDKSVDVPASGLRYPIKLAHRNVTLIVKVDPAEASVNLLSEGKAIATAQSGGKITFGRGEDKAYEVEARARGYANEKRSLQFSGDAEEILEITLARDGTVAVQSPTPTPQVDPTPTPKTSPRPKKPKNNGGGSSNSGGSSSPPKTLAKTATLRIGTKRGVKPATVYVDSVSIGTTPISSYKVTPGRHKIKWRWDDGRELSETVVLEDGEARTLKRG
jgi:serine/threonine-protein kinase